MSKIEDTLRNSIRENLFITVTPPSDETYNCGDYIYLGNVEIKDEPTLYVFGANAAKKNVLIRMPKKSNVPDGSMILIYKPPVGKLTYNGKPMKFILFDTRLDDLVSNEEKLGELKPYVDRNCPSLKNIATAVQGIINKIYSEFAVDERLRMPILMIVHTFLTNPSFNVTYDGKKYTLQDFCNYWYIDLDMFDNILKCIAEVDFKDWFENFVIEKHEDMKQNVKQDSKTITRILDAVKYVKDDSESDSDSDSESDSEDEKFEDNSNSENKINTKNTTSVTPVSTTTVSKTPVSTTSIDKLTENRNEYWEHTIYALNKAKFFKEHVIDLIRLWYDGILRKIKYVDGYDVTKTIYDVYRHHIKATSKKGYYTTECVKQLCAYIFKDIMFDNCTFMDPCCGTGGFSSYMIHNKPQDIYCKFIQNDCEDTAYIAWLNGKLRTDDKTEIQTYCSDCFSPEFICKVNECSYEELLHVSKKVREKIRDVESSDKIDFLGMNPPYGMGGKIKIDINPWIVNEGGNGKVTPNEWNFCRYAMEMFCKRGAWFFYIIPSSCVSDSSGNIKIKEKILKECEIWYVIKMREDIFKPFVTNIQTVILIGRYLKDRKKENIKKWKTKCVDFSKDDKGEVREKKGTLEYDYDSLKKLWDDKIFSGKCLDGLETTDDFKVPPCIDVNGKCSKYATEIVLTEDIDWMYSVDSGDTASVKNTSGDGRLSKGYVRKTLHKGFEKKRRAWFDDNIDKIDFEKFIKESEDCEWRSIKITDLFEYVGKGKYKNIEDISDNGPYPLISGRYVNDGVSKRIDKYDYEGNQYFTVPGCADIYNMYFHEENFAATTNVHILKLSKEFEYAKTYANEIAKVISSEFNDGTYSYHGNNLSRDRLLSEKVELPFNKKTNKIDFSITNVLDEEDIGLFKDVKITDLFEILQGVGNKYIKDVKNTGEYPLISCSTKNHGVSTYVDAYDYDGDYITVATDGAAGTCFDQHGKFSITGKVITLKPKDTNIVPVLPELAFIMTLHLRMKYGYKNKCDKEALEKEFIPQLPFLPNPDTGKLELSIDGIKNIYIYI